MSQPGSEMEEICDYNVVRKTVVLVVFIGNINHNQVKWFHGKI